ncbi:G3E family GTPase [Ruminiclostridium sufflavum DSM 19573]|uniref:G3E family GTPase n=1 Tax=Ruminiclostridium sufflavum DSM 19573 TaxID=1121337 RepID=A0A318Y101_9FIRM|nr:GTP-binding protein [Ruminiclostridium sufflavum]PYG89049.1 G3E family GTPase [Ruminiclostridium sufflavum DSM 19573]
MTKVDIISGFLGAGKTTLIKKLLGEKLGKEKLVIIENEFGEIGIDGNILKESNVEVKEINSGCICCTLAGDFCKAIEEVSLRYNPDRIIIEPSGVGKLSDVIKACKADKLKDIIEINMIIAVVDVLKYRLFISNFGEFYKNQLVNAKTIILSRTQKADNKELETITNSIRELNNKANIITTEWDSLSSDTIITVAEQDASESLEERMIKKVTLKKAGHQNSCKCGGSNKASHNHSADEEFDTWGIETPKRYKEAELKGILDMLGNEKQFGMILRGKGILQLTGDRWIQFDYTPGELDMKDTVADYTGRMCIIGKDLKKSEIKRIFGFPA